MFPTEAKIAVAKELLWTALSDNDMEFQPTAVRLGEIFIFNVLLSSIIDCK